MKKAAQVALYGAFITAGFALTIYIFAHVRCPPDAWLIKGMCYGPKISDVRLPEWRW